MRLPYHDIKFYCDQCAGLPIRGTSRFNHRGCATSSGSRSLAVTRTDSDSLVVYCHKCNGTGGTGGTYDPTEAKPSGNRIWKKPDWEYRVREFPVQVKVWLGGQWVTNNDLEALGVRYDTANESLQFTVWGEEGETRAAAGRINRQYSKDATSKYICSGQRSWLRCTSSTTLVLVEDYLSCVQAGMAGYSAMLLGGTRLTDDSLSSILAHKWERIVVYLDNDNPDVRKSQRDIYRTLSFYYPVVVLREDRDPKELTVTELQELIG
jgi:hypothetical protein